MKGKIFFIMLCMIFLIGSVSASDWDNKLSYSNNDLKVEFKNSILGLIPTSEIGTAELKSHSSVNYVKEVGLGKQVVMYYDFSFVELYKNALGEPEFIDMKTGKKVERDWRYVYWNEDKEGYIDENGTTQIKDNSQWLPCNSRDISKGNTRIGIEVEVRPNDWIDGVWSVGGKKINRHAEWTASGDETWTVALGTFDSIAAGTIRWINLTALEYGIITNVRALSGNSDDTDPITITILQDGDVLATKTGNFPDTHTYNVPFTLADYNNDDRVISPNLDSGNFQIRMNRTVGDMRISNTDLDFSGSLFTAVDQRPFRSTNTNTGNIIYQEFTCVNGTPNVNGKCIAGIYINLISPIDTLNSTNNTIDFSFNATFNEGAGIKNATINVYNLTGNIFSETNASGYNGTYSTSHIFIDGNYSWNITAYDDSNVNYSSATRSFTIDLIEPNVTLLEPENDTQTGNASLIFKGNLTAGNYTLINATLNIWYENGTLFKTQTNVSIAGTSDANVTFNISNFSVGDFVWNILLNYENSVRGTYFSVLDENNFTFEWIPFENLGESYNTDTYETQNETFVLNISTDENVDNMGAFLNYNGTDYAGSHSCSGGLCQIQREMDIPLLLGSGNYENKTFYWKITLFGDFGTFTTTTSEHQQNVSNIIFTNSSSGNTKAVNFTIYNETTRSLTKADFKGTFNFYLGSGTVKDSFNISGEERNSYTFYINHNQTFITNSKINIKNGTSQRNYEFNKEEYTNSSRTQKLFLPDDDSSVIIIEVKDEGLIPMEDIIVNISRFYPALNLWRVIESKKTDEFGQIVANLVENDAKYKFTFYNLDNELLKTSEDITIACRSSICILPFIIEAGDSFFERFEDMDLFSYELTFSNSTNTFRYVWDDQRGERASYRLQVRRLNLNQSSIICNSTSTETVSTLTCAVGDVPASYQAQAFRKLIGGGWRRVALLNIKVGDSSTTYGVEGLFWVFILLFTAIGIGVYDPKIGAVVYGIGFIIMGIIDLISMPLPVFFANTLLVAIFIWAVRT